MKKLCKDCNTRFEVPLDDLEHGDPFDCPECGLEYTLILEEDSKPKLVESKKLALVEDEDESEDEENDYEESDD